MVTITIDNQRIAVDGRLTILEAAKTAHIEIPHLCYLKGINDIGACRICAVELEGKDRLVTACNTLVQEGMVIYTNSPKVRHARRCNVQLLLSQHDCECAYCSRSGNCELQKVSNELGITALPYEKKVTYIPWNQQFPLIRESNKCIKCMRCIQICDKVQDLRVWDVQKDRFPHDRKCFVQSQHRGSGMQSVRPVHHPLSGQRLACAGRQRTRDRRVQRS